MNWTNIYLFLENNIACQNQTLSSEKLQADTQKKNAG